MLTNENMILINSCALINNKCIYLYIQTHWTYDLRVTCVILYNKKNVGFCDAFYTFYCILIHPVRKKLAEMDIFVSNMNLKLICFRIKNVIVKLFSHYIMILALQFITLITLVSVNHLLYLL